MAVKVPSGLEMQLKFFEGDLNQIALEFNKWSKKKYIRETTLHFRRNDTAVMKVLYANLK